MDYPKVIQSSVAAQIKSETNALTEMCERMLVTPGLPGGIAVQRTWKRNGLTCSVETSYWFDERIPPMTIGYLPDIYEDGWAG